MKRVCARVAVAAAASGLFATDHVTHGAEGPRLVPWSPALAAIAFEIGRGPQVVGITQWTRLPPGESRPVVGDAHSVHLEALLAVRPDLVVLQSEPPAGLREAQRLYSALRVERLGLERLADIPRAARRLHELSGGDPQQPPPTITEFEQTIEQYQDRPPPPRRPRVLFIVGTEHPLVAGPATFVGDIIQLAGGDNAAADLPGRPGWNVVGLEHLWQSRPDILLVHAPTAEAAAARDWWRRRWPSVAGTVPRRIAVSDPSWLQPSLGTARCLGELARRLADDSAEDTATTAGVDQASARADEARRRCPGDSR